MRCVRLHAYYALILLSDEVFVVLLKLLEEPISKPSHLRSEEDKVAIELVLTLVK
jgi:hypothetical protein